MLRGPGRSSAGPGAWVRVLLVGIGSEAVADEESRDAADGEHRGRRENVSPVEVRAEEQVREHVVDHHP